MVYDPMKFILLERTKTKDYMLSGKSVVASDRYPLTKCWTSKTIHRNNRPIVHSYSGNVQSACDMSGRYTAVAEFGHDDIADCRTGQYE